MIMIKMRHKKMKLVAILLLALGVTGLRAQEAVPASGGNALGSGGSCSYTIGQLAYTSISGTSGSFTQGVQQPYEILVLTGIEKNQGINLMVNAYPNPTSNYLSLRIGNSELSGISYRLCDMNGKLLESKMVENNETTIKMSHFAPSAYFLKIIENSKEIKTFKIIKN